MGLFDFLLGKGTFTDEQRAQLEAEGLVVIEEGLRGTIRYTHFKSPGRRFHGKITPEKLAIGVSRERVMIYCRGGRGKLTDSPFTEPRLAIAEARVEDGDTFVWHVDYDKGDLPKVSGQVTIRARTPSAARIVEAIQAGRRAAQ